MVIFVICIYTIYIYILLSMSVFAKILVIETSQSSHGEAHDRYHTEGSRRIKEARNIFHGSGALVVAPPSPGTVLRFTNPSAYRDGLLKSEAG